MWINQVLECRDMASGHGVWWLLNFLHAFITAAILYFCDLCVRWEQCGHFWLPQLLTTRILLVQFRWILWEGDKTNLGGYGRETVYGASLNASFTVSFCHSGLLRLVDAACLLPLREMWQDFLVKSATSSWIFFFCLSTCEILWDVNGPDCLNIRV